MTICSPSACLLIGKQALCASVLPHEAPSSCSLSHAQRLNACHVLRFRQCAAISAADGRWRASNCSAALPTACRMHGSGEWLLTRPGSPGGCKALAPGEAFKLPRHAKENLALAETLRAARPHIDAAWLPLTGGATLAQGGPCRVPHTLCTPKVVLCCSSAISGQFMVL